MAVSWGGEGCVNNDSLSINCCFISSSISSASSKVALRHTIRMVIKTERGRREGGNVQSRETSSYVSVGL